MAQKNLIVLMFSVLALGACQSPIGDAVSFAESNRTIDSGSETPRSTTPDVDRSYNIFYSPADHIDDLLDEGHVDAASLVYEKQRDYFSGDRKKKVDPLAVALSQSFSPKINVANRKLAATSFTVEPESWSEFKSTLSTADDLVESVEGHRILQEPGRELSEASTLRTTLKNKKRELDEKAIDAFLSYPIRSKPNFFDEYPTEIDATKFFENNEAASKRLLSVDGSTELAAVYKIYENQLAPKTKQTFAQKHFEEVVREEQRSGKPSPQATLAAIDKANTSGMPMPQFSKSEISLVTLLGTGASKSFELTIENDLSVHDQNQTLERFRATEIPEAEVVVLFVPAVADAEREIIKHEQIKSEYREGFKTTPNPRYAAAQAEVDRARINLQSSALNKANVDSQYCVGNGCIGKLIAQIAAGVSHGKRQDEYDAAITSLRSMSSTIETPVYKPYTFNKTTVQTSKTATINYYVIDKNNKTFYSGNFKKEENKVFNIPYGLHDDDRYRSRHLDGASSEDDVNDFASASALLKTSGALSRLAKSELKSVPFKSLSDVTNRIEADKTVLAKVRAKKSRDFGTTARRNDKRIESVIAVISKGDLAGAGFFIREDLVLTNLHVVEGSQFVELKTFEGAKTFGMVTAVDPRLDLALVETKATGVPIKLFSEKNLSLGESVIAIGHPHGLEFSFTQGVISGVREMESIHARGGNQVRYIQTDTAINPGNSGGPLFFGSRVIGVNTWKVTAKSEGLGFAVHYGEVKDFLSRNGVSIGPSS